MIDIQDKTECSGCAACAAICGHNCITMTSDAEGFKYPEVDKEKCVNCGLCDRVCPILNIPDDLSIKEVIAAKNKNSTTPFLLIVCSAMRRKIPPDELSKR